MNPNNNATTWLLAVWESDLSTTQKLICCYLRTHMNDYRDMAWPSAGRIAKKCGLSERTIFRELPKICDSGFLLRNGTSNHGTVRYEISTPDTVSPLTSCHETYDTVSPELTKELTNTLSKGKPKKRFVKPTVEQVAEYCRERNNDIDPSTFVDWNESKGWRVGNAPMKDWKAAIRTWEKRNEKTNGRYQKPQHAGRLSAGDRVRQKAALRTAADEKQIN